MPRMVMAVSGRSTRTGATLGASMSRRGLSSNPPLAITAQACASCKAVTPISCPMATEPMELFCQTRSGRTIPEDSPGSGTPVFLPNPNRRM